MGSDVETGDGHDEVFDEVEYEKGFNWGFIIGEHDPVLAKDLMGGIVHDSSRASGLVAGFQEFFQEKEQSRLDELEDLRDKGKDKERKINR